MSNKKARKVESVDDSFFGEEDDFVEDGDTVESLYSPEHNKKLSLLLPKENDNFLDEQEENDDEQERKKEKEEEENRKRQALRVVEKPKGSVFNDALKNLSPTAMEDHYVKCIQLSSENKVNQKNAFKLQLIDCMKLIFVNKSKKTDNLALMGCTLDASAKIYSYRVDKVYTDMMKFMTGKIFKEAKEGEDDNDEDKEGEDENDVGETPKKKRKKNRGSGEDEELDYGKFLCNEKELQKTQNDGDGLLKERITLPSQYEYFLECPLRDPYGLLSLNCPIFDVEEEELSIARVSTSDFANSTDATLDPSLWISNYKEMHKHFFVVGELNETVSIDKTLAYDSTLSDRTVEQYRNYSGGDDMDIEGITPEPIIDYDDDFSDCEAPMPVSLKFSNKSQPANSTMNKTSFSIRGMSNLVSIEDNDYSFFDNSKLNFWAGPSHWSIKPNRKRLALPNNLVCPPTAAKSAKKQMSLDFDAVDSEKMKNLFCEKALPVLARKTLKSWTTIKSRTSNRSYTAKNLLSLFSNNIWSFMNKDLTSHGIFTSNKFKSLDESSQELSPDSFNCREENDEADVNMLDDHNEDSYEGQNDAMPLDTLPESNESFMELIPAPHKVSKIVVNYSKCQKNVDIKALKSTIWKYMDLDNSAKENIPPSDDVSGKRNCVEGAVAFSKVFKALHQLVPVEESASFSCGVVFMSLLHMANEKVLSLQGTEALDDFRISLG